MLARRRGVVLVFLLSAIFSKTAQVSLFGTMFDLGTFWFIFAGFLLLLMSSIVFRDSRDAKIVLFGLILSSTLVLIFQSVHFIFPKILTLGVLVEKTDNLIGSWNALVFCWIFALMSLLIVEFSQPLKWKNSFFNYDRTFCCFLIAAVNFPFIWGILGVSYFDNFVYKISISATNRGEDHHKKQSFPVFSFVVIMISLLFLRLGFYRKCFARSLRFIKY